jgi:hypothetical protein
MLASFVLATALRLVLAYSTNLPAYFGSRPEITTPLTSFKRS